MPTEHLLFVYGSLMQGFQYHHMLSGAVFVASGQTGPRWTLIDLGHYPAATPGTHRIDGEVYAVDSAALSRLDRLEGCPELYCRTQAVLEDGHEVFIYQLQPAATPDEPVVIPSGSWRAWCAGRTT